jgi:16S rRNA (adenine1518-N6/adenine1519-N6)-dimethyltransferase
VQLAELAPDARVLEVGPGLGALTVALADAGAHVVALEVDERLVSVLHDTVSGHGDVTVRTGDAATVDLSFLDPGPWSCVSNLPYNVATPVVVRLLEEAPAVTSLLVMTQREVGERLAAAPGARGSGAVSVKVAYFSTARVVGSVPRSVFVPTPKVDSVLVRLDRHAAPPVVVPSRTALFALVRDGFAHRRQMLRRTLRSRLGTRVEATLEDAGIAPTRRAESLTLDDWARLARTADARL